MTLIINLDILLENHGHDGINYDLDNFADMLLVIDELNKIIDRLMIMIKKMRKNDDSNTCMWLNRARWCLCIYSFFSVCVCVSIYFFF